jgi:transglutaminase-like putative cysteine protease
MAQRRMALPPAWLRAALALDSFLGVLGTYQMISGVGQGSALLAVMGSLKLLETRQRRDQFVLLFIAIFLVMSALLREQYIWSLPYLLAAVVLIMTAWLRLSGEPRQSTRARIATGGRLVAYAVPLAVAMWVFFPRLSAPFWAVPIDTSSGTTGLSNQMSPGDIISLSQSSAVAFRVRFEDSAPAPRDRYFRAMVLHKFDGRSWTGYEPLLSQARDLEIDVRGDPVRYEMTLEPTRQHWIPALEIAREWQLPNTIMGRAYELSRTYPVDQRLSFTIESYPDFRIEPELRRGARDWYLRYPAERNTQTIELARKMFVEAGSPEHFAEAVLARFHNEDYYYTLQPPALGSNPVDRFLFETRRGFCEHYASAFALMMRAAGVPARVVLGYQGGEMNPLGDYMIVRQSDAHAWTEVWYEGRGWTRIDPTSAVAPERIELGFTESMFDGIGRQWGGSAPSELLHRVKLSWDAVNARWNDWVLGYGPDTQRSFMQLLGMEKPGWRKMMLTLITLVVLLTLAVSAALMWRYRPPPRDRASVLYRRFVNRAGIEPECGETPLQYAGRVAVSSNNSRDKIHSITEAYLAARYADNPAALGRLEDLLKT